MADLSLSRRAAAMGLAGAALGHGVAAGQESQAERFAPGRPWTLSRAGATFPLDAPLEGPDGSTSVRAVLAGRPGVVNLWATWCPPCIAEKPFINRLAERLASEGDHIAIIAVLAYDRSVQEADEVRKALDRHGGAALLALRALPAAEAAFTRHFGPGRSPTRPAMPSTALVGADGVELGRIEGAAQIGFPARSYWTAPEATAMFTRLSALTTP